MQGKKTQQRAKEQAKRACFVAFACCGYSLSTLNLSFAPHLGQVRAWLFDVLSNNSDTSQPKAKAIFSKVSKLGVWSPVIIRLSEVVESPTRSASSFCVVPY